MRNGAKVRGPDDAPGERMAVMVAAERVFRSGGGRRVSAVTGGPFKSAAATHHGTADEVS